MSNVVIIHLDRPRELRFGHKALKTMEELTGKTIPEIEETFLSGQASIALIEKCVYAGLLSDAKAHNETLTLEKVEDLLDGVEDYFKVFEAVGSAFQKAFGVKTGDSGGNLPQPAQEPGKGGNTTGTKA